MPTTLFAAGGNDNGRDRNESGVDGGGGGGGTGGFLFDSADLLDAVSAIRSPNRSDFLPIEGDWGMVHVSEGVSPIKDALLFFVSCEKRLLHCSAGAAPAVHVQHSYRLFSRPSATP